MCNECFLVVTLTVVQVNVHFNGHEHFFITVGWHSWEDFWYWPAVGSFRIKDE